MEPMTQWEEIKLFVWKIIYHFLEAKDFYLLMFFRKMVSVFGTGILYIYAKKFDNKITIGISGPRSFNDSGGMRAVSLLMLNLESAKKFRENLDQQIMVLEKEYPNELG